jgi:hypothetical protein
LAPARTGRHICLEPLASSESPISVLSDLLSLKLEDKMLDEVLRGPGYSGEL